MRTLSCSLAATALLCLAQSGLAQPTMPGLLAHQRTVLDAHNCYPYEGQYADRIDRALSVGYPVAIEQDLAWYADASGTARVVVSHTAKTTGTEPTLRAYFFERVRPIMEQALRENRKDQWPLIVVHFDVKDNREPLLRQTWELLGEYRDWITTAVKSADTHELTPFDVKPLLVLTEDADAQEAVFYRDVPVGAKLRLFGSAHTTMPASHDRSQLAHLAVTAPPETLLAERPTTYRRWWNNGWAVVEEGGQQHAGEWTADDAARLKALVDHAHRLGFWIRFYTLDGFTPAEDKGWGAPYNFGSHRAAELRWKAALDAGVDLVATDQYEDLAAFLKTENKKK
jgi:hypothetical protein